MSKSLICHAVVANAAAVIAAASASTRTIDAATVVNTSGSAATLTLWMVPASGSRAEGNKLLQALAIDAGETMALEMLINHCFPKDATIHAEASAATALTLILSGRSQ